MITPLIPHANPGANYFSHQVAIREAMARVLASGRYMLGPEVEQFEREFADWCGVTEAVGVGSGTDALVASLRALNIGQGDEVITTAHTAVATVSAIELVNATPVLVDIDPQTFTLDANLVEAAITERTRALIPVHIYGIPGDLAAYSKITDAHGLTLIEDCAQAHGARFQGQLVGSWGHVAAFSFYPTKNLGALGDGGAVTTNDTELAQHIRRLAQYGWSKRYISEEAGFNTRLDAIQAAVLRVKLQALDTENKRRRIIANQYSDALAYLVGVPKIPADRESVFHLYVIRYAQRDALKAFLQDQGIGTAIHYPMPIHLQPAYRERLGDTGSYPHSEQAAQEILSLPMYPELTDEHVQTVINAICKFA